MNTCEKMIYDNLIVGRVPKKIKERTKENMEVHHMGLADSFQEAVRTYAKKERNCGRLGIMTISGNIYLECVCKLRGCSKSAEMIEYRYETT